MAWRGGTPMSAKSTWHQRLTLIVRPRVAYIYVCKRSW
jgi:hypothetical protein